MSIVAEGRYFGDCVQVSLGRFEVRTVDDLTTPNGIVARAAYLKNNNWIYNREYSETRLL